MITTHPTNGQYRYYLKQVILGLLFILVALVMYVFVESMQPGAQVTKPPVLLIDISNLKEGEVLIKKFRESKVIVLHRTPQQIQDISTNYRFRKQVRQNAVIPDFKGLIPNYRSLRPDYFVAYAWPGIPEQCSVWYREAGPGTYDKDHYKWVGGFYEPCRGAVYDSAGHILVGTWPLSRDLPIPTYSFIKKSLIEVIAPRTIPVAHRQ